MAELNELIHQPVRLRLMAALSSLGAGDTANFTYLRDLLEVTDGNLGAHLRRLEDAGYIELTKTYVDRKPRTYVSITSRGRAVFEEHVAALEEILK
jgi:DNA-binding MarR family transcriptional regulator